MSDAVRIREHLDVVEEAYEFMLAYAAQGRSEEGAATDGAHIRTFVQRFAAAADAIEPLIGALIGRDRADGGALKGSFERDSGAVRSILQLLLARDNISSEMVDNINGMIVVRSYLTTLFFVDKVLIPSSD